MKTVARWGGKRGEKQVGAVKRKEKEKKEIPLLLEEERFCCRRAILTNPDLLASTPWYRLFENDFWGTPLTERGSHGSYRPLCVATFRLNHFLGGLEPWGYHLVNVALHAACTVLVVKVARKVLPGRSNLAHAITGFLFAVHPIHSEAVAGIVGRADLLACFLTLTSFLTYSAHCNRTRPSFPLLLALVSSTLATLAKETGISSLALCLLWELCRGEPSRKGNCSVFTRGRSVGILSGGLALLALGRLKLVGSRPEFASADNPTARHPSRLTRSLTFLYLPAASARMLLCPSTLSFDWSMDAVPRITSPFDPRNLESVCLYAVLIAATFWAVRAATAVAVSLGFLVLPFLPASNLFFYVGFVIAERILYLPSVGACLAVGAVVSGCYRIARRNGSRTRGRAVLLGTAILIGVGRADANALAYSSDDASVLILTLPQALPPLLPGFNSLHLTAAINITQVAKCSVQTALLKYCIIALERARKQRNDGRAYLDRDNSQVIAARIIINTESVRPYGNLGSILSEQGRVAEAEEAFVQALRYRPNMADVHYNLGILQQGRKNYDEAILSYQRAIHFRPSLAQAYVNLGAALISVGRGTDAAAVLRAGASLDGSGLKDKRAHEAARVQALLQLGALYADQGRLQRALSAYREALRALPDHYPPQSVYNLLGETLSRLQQYAEAERWFQASLASQPDHVPAHITYGKLLARNSSRVLEAERWFLRARRLAPDDPSVHHHYGLFLTSQGRLVEAAEEQLRAAELVRSDYELSVAAASALRQADRRDEAEVWYRHAASLRPHEARSHTNLGAILHLNGKYKQAAAAYKEALRLQPGDATTITNLHKLAAILA
ncbi:hypothetical protein ALC57_06995 [Trachymyrmex cornetzi]|uniref:dolichyl-phosphate-mannose--protein mannosyltransferase n=1 Tax=Trachymyrmex cornetzi TaxID=471704 RepID=A0A195E681_9HYME|nr:hypothetical protein ALC57_06995 [Trachymyrmex cornetzi]